MLLSGKSAFYEEAKKIVKSCFTVNNSEVYLWSKITTIYHITCINRGPTLTFIAFSVAEVKKYCNVFIECGKVDLQ